MRCDQSSSGRRHAVVRDGLRALLDAQTDIEPVGDAANGRKVLRQALQLHSDVLVMILLCPK